MMNEKWRSFSKIQKLPTQTQKEKRLKLFDQKFELQY